MQDCAADDSARTAVALKQWRADVGACRKTFSYLPGYQVVPLGAGGACQVRP